MFYVLLIFHIIVCLLLVIVILLQSGKGGGLASSFGGAGTTEAVFGGRQAATFLSKATSVLGTIFFLGVFGLALLSSYQGGPKSAVQEQLQKNAVPMAPAPVTQPVGGDMLQGNEQNAPANAAPTENAQPQQSGQSTTPAQP